MKTNGIGSGNRFHFESGGAQLGLTKQQYSAPSQQLLPSSAQTNIGQTLASCQLATSDHVRAFSDLLRNSSIQEGAAIAGRGGATNFSSLQGGNSGATAYGIQNVGKANQDKRKQTSKSRSSSRNVATTNSGIGQNPKLATVNLAQDVLLKYRAQQDLSSPVVQKDRLSSAQTIGSSATGQVGGGLSRSSSHVILQQALSNNEKVVNTKVFARFRPLNKVEVELTRSDMGQDCCLYPDEKTVVLMPESTVFTMDSVFDPNTSQHRVYEMVGRETISDVMNGYNGTIFAYGQTGSGKTYSMFGDLHKKNLKGIIPRAIEHIFQTIHACEIDIEFILTCSMLEIYKENLHDLLNTDKVDLKIKESPIKGIYVEGLTQLCVGTEHELLTMLELGDQARKVAATRINQYSSRSHTIFMLEIKQRYPNDSEKKGKLNLVDLAGSEKVGKTGAIGEILEEAKKINLSLSCLGHVIHSLTTNSEHIPYRDSKLTRILSESLGGNFKTSLLVTCSSHSTSLEESISTLKFATRAKSIKNHFKMNIKNSPDALQKIIQQLKRELIDAKYEIDNFKKNGEIFIPNEDTIQQLPNQAKKPLLQKNHLNNSAAATAQQDQESNDSVLFSNVNKHLMLHEKIEEQKSELRDMKELLKEQDTIIHEQEQQIEKLKRNNLQLEDKLSQSQQDREVLQQNIQNNRLSNEMSVQQRMKEVVQIETQLHSLNEMMRAYMQQRQAIDVTQLNTIIGDGLSKIQDLQRDSSDVLLKVDQNVYATLKDIKISVLNQRLVSQRLRQIATKIHEQSPKEGAQVRDPTNLHLLFYETLRTETLHCSLECSIRSLEIQEALNYQKNVILNQKYLNTKNLKDQLDTVLFKAMRTHMILRERIDDLEEFSAKYQDSQIRKSKVGEVSTIGNTSCFDGGSKKSKIINSVVIPNAAATTASTREQIAASKNYVKQSEDAVQDWFVEEVAQYQQMGVSIEVMVEQINANGFFTVQKLTEVIKGIVKEGSVAEKILQDERLQINNEIFVSENTRLRDKVLVLTTELDLSTTKSDILETELKKKTSEVIEVNELLKSTNEKTEDMLRKEFSSLKKQINETHSPIYQEILDFFKKRNAFTDSMVEGSKWFEQPFQLQYGQQQGIKQSSPSESPAQSPSSAGLQNITNASRPSNKINNASNIGSLTRGPTSFQSSTSSSVTSIYNNTSQLKPTLLPKYSTPLTSQVNSAKKPIDNYQSSNISSHQSIAPVSESVIFSKDLYTSITPSITSSITQTLQSPPIQENSIIVAATSPNPATKSQALSMGFRYDYSFLSDYGQSRQKQFSQQQQQESTSSRQGSSQSYQSKY